MGGLLRKYMEKKKITLFEQNRVNLDSYFFEPFQEISENYDTSKVFETDKVGTKKKLPLLPRPLTNFSFFMDVLEKFIKLETLLLQKIVLCL